MLVRMVGTKPHGSEVFFFLKLLGQFPHSLLLVKVIVVVAVEMVVMVMMMMVGMGMMVLEIRTPMTAESTLLRLRNSQGRERKEMKDQ